MFCDSHVFLLLIIIWHSININTLPLTVLVDEALICAKNLDGRWFFLFFLFPLQRSRFCTELNNTFFFRVQKINFMCRSRMLYLLLHKPSAHVSVLTRLNEDGNVFTYSNMYNVVKLCYTFRKDDPWEHFAPWIQGSEDKGMCLGIDLQDRLRRPIIPPPPRK